ncbi:ABC-three component system protein [Ensifer sp. R-19]|uniref:ABC-three component system protein n=1 Tax=Ensifer sp. R-19 TaxID=3404055 RepID=UPI003CE819B9
MNTVDQRSARAERDVIGRDKNVIIEAPKTMVEKLLHRLREQYDSSDETKITIDELARYHVRRSQDGIQGLENKLIAANMSHYYDDAIEKKEMFAKLLERWSLYSSAQAIFVHILAKTEAEFSHVIYPQIPKLSECEMNAMIMDRIVNPVVEECNSELMTISHNIVLGMVYWLAEQCFIRWHHSPRVVA